MTQSISSVSASCNSCQQSSAYSKLQENPSAEQTVQAQSEESEQDVNSSISETYTDSEIRALEQLKQRDREVRAHELAHVAAGGQYITSGANFSYQKGPDGRLYAVGGEVSISTSEVPQDPQATLEKAMTILRAALAPADPSSQDRQVAAQAAAMAQRARAEFSSQSSSEPGSTFDQYA